MNEPVKNRVTVYEVERFCERLHKLVIETHPSLGEPSFILETGTLRVSFPAFEGSAQDVPAPSEGERRELLDEMYFTKEPKVKVGKSKKVPQ